MCSKHEGVSVMKCLCYRGVHIMEMSVYRGVCIMEVSTVHLCYRGAHYVMEECASRRRLFYEDVRIMQVSWRHVLCVCTGEVN